MNSKYTNTKKTKCYFNKNENIFSNVVRTNVLISIPKINILMI